MTYKNESDMLTNALMCTSNDFQNICHHSNRTWNPFNRTVGGEICISKSHAESDFETVSTLGYHQPKVEDVRYWILAAIVFIFVRRLIERNIFIPLGKRFGIKDGSSTKTPTVPSRISSSSAGLSLEKAYVSTLSKSKLPNLVTNKLCIETGMTIREVERWFRMRKAIDRPSTLIKFSESGWRFVCYVTSTSIGIWSLWNKPWAWDTNLCWVHDPSYNPSIDIWVYYTYSLGLYISFLMTQAFDVKRKDFWEMFVHHIITIVLLVVVIMCNPTFTRIAVYTLFVHDCGDVLLEAGKMSNYSKHENLTTGIFTAFTFVWIVTRLIIYPKKIMIDTIVHIFSNEHLSKAVVYTVTTLVIMLFGLHLFWTYHISKIAIAMLSGNEKVKDTRSSSESCSSEEDEAPKFRHQTNNLKN